MVKIASDVTALIGHTPLVALREYSRKRGLREPLLAKVEAMNPGGSAKDRVALAMIEAAESEGRLRPGGTIIEPTSGNTGVGLAMVAAVRGYRLILTMPETMSRERQLLANSYRNSLRLAEEHGCRSVAFPSISTGVYAFPLELAAPIALTTIRNFLDTAAVVETVTMVCYDLQTLAAYRQAL